MPIVRLILLVVLSASLFLSVLPAAAQEYVKSGRPVVYEIAALSRSGEFGTVTLTPYAGGHTEVDIALVGAPAEDLQPVNVYLGSCSKLDPHPKYILNYAVSGISQTILAVQLSTLIAGGFSVNVHKSTNDVDTYVACGSLGRSSLGHKK